MTFSVIHRLALVAGTAATRRKIHHYSGPAANRGSILLW